MDNAAETRIRSRGNLASFLSEKLRCCPSLPVLISVLFTILPGVILPGRPALSAVSAVLLTLAGWYCLGTQRAFFRTALPAFLALSSLLWDQQMRQNDPLSRLVHSRTQAGIEAKLQVCDPSVYDDGTALPRRRILCRVTAVRFSPEDRWTPIDSRVLAGFPPEMPLRLHWGDTFRVTGRLSRPDARLMPGGFDYGEYLLRRRIHFLLLANEAEKTGTVPSVYGGLLAARDRLLRSLTRSISDPAEKALAAGLLFGCRQEISQDAKSAYIRSGTIHILTVSGLHVGMFAAALFLLLLPVPFRTRMILAPVLTLLYAFAAGMQMPAMRAVVMLFCWCIPRAFMLRGNGLNAVMFAGALLLLWNPFQLLDPGFQYSFTCVFFLILSADRGSEWMQLAVEKRQWIPHGKITRRDRLRTRFLTALASAAAGCLTAWLCSSVLTIYYQGLTVPFALAANLLILPAVSLIFILFTAALLPCLVFPAAGAVFSPLLAVPLGMIEPVCRFFAGLSDGRIASPPGWVVFAWLAMLFPAVAFSGRRAGFIGAAGLAVLIFLPYSGMLSRPGPELLLLYGGRQHTPAVIWSDPAEGFSAAANLADHRSAAAAADHLKGLGLPGLSLLVSPGAARENAEGALHLLKMVRVREYLARTPSPRSAAAWKAAQLAEASGARLILSPEQPLRWHSGRQKIETFLKNGVFSFDICQNEHKVQVKIACGPYCEPEAVIREDGGPERKIRLPRDRIPGIVRIELNWKKAEDQP
ncbi:MAG: ComEC family competence protein [Lentisphaeria bacterium]|nr:ComEC family competence protein [Lentisphaeria bacterium]